MTALVTLVADIVAVLMMMEAATMALIRLCSSGLGDGGGQAEASGKGW